MKVGGQFSYRMLHLSAKRHIIIIWWDDALWKTFWATILKDQLIPFGSLVEYHPKIAKDQSRHPSIWKESLIWIVPWIRFVRRWNLEAWHIGRRPWGVGYDGRIGNYSKRLNAKEVIFPKGPENIHFGTASTNSRRKQFLIFLENQSGLLHHLKTRFGCRWSDKWFLVHVRKLHLPPSRWTQSLKLYSPREESFPIPLKYIDVILLIQTWMLCKRNASMIFGNIDGSRDLSDPWGRFHTIYSTRRKSSWRIYTWSGRRLTRKQITTRPDHLWPEIWKSMGKNAKLKERKKWVAWKAPFW